MLPKECLFSPEFDIAIRKSLLVNCPKSPCSIERGSIAILDIQRLENVAAIFVASYIDRRKRKRMWDMVSQ